MISTPVLTSAWFGSAKSRWPHPTFKWTEGEDAVHDWSGLVSIYLLIWPKLQRNCIGFVHDFFLKPLGSSHPLIKPAMAALAELSSFPSLVVCYLKSAQYKPLYAHALFFIATSTLLPLLTEALNNFYSERDGLTVQRSAATTVFYYVHLLY